MVTPEDQKESRSEPVEGTGAQRQHPVGPEESSEGRGGLANQVCEPPPSSHRSRHWSLSIEERRQRASQGGCERRRAAGVSLHCQEIMQIVAQLVSEDVDKDVLIPHPPRSSESTHAFHAFLARSSPFWQNVTLEP
ncbi:testis-expressed protein 22 isoform X2 [Rousettus aegyptiacus]|uniref:Testis expressed 22 n=1 Tax=Rousettus aegyptiacus TaxID=9407 RepID=A0A7J8B6F3_ROUAE|nr:testis-expressed protein 22 isoform X2 [Rousettus aegyptiacus]KAF6394433.1 testis expressed 22 [Rousettus aegyptiacus]